VYEERIYLSENSLDEIERNPDISKYVVLDLATMSEVTINKEYLLWQGKDMGTLQELLMTIGREYVK
jgi:hypothetical protein